MAKQRGIFKTNDIPGYFLVRVILGYVFLVAGLQKFIFPDAMGAERFAQMGFVCPEFTAYLVGFFEIACAVLILIGLVCRLATIPLIVIMSVAIVVTKVPRLELGFWPFAQALRLDLVMLFLAIFVLCNGADKLSLDYKLFKFRGHNT